MLEFDTGEAAMTGGACVATPVAPVPVAAEGREGAAAGAITASACELACGMEDGLPIESPPLLEMLLSAMQGVTTRRSRKRNSNDK